MATWGDWGLRPAVTSKDVVCQAVSDWFGKEVQNGYTVTYVWMTNQLGHFTLGFLFTFIIDWIAQTVGAVVNGCTPWSATPWAEIRADDASCVIDPQSFWCGWMLLVPLLQIAFWSGKEARDFAIAVKAASSHEFPVNRTDIARDAVTAVWFITAGILVAHTSFVSWLGALLIFAVELAIALIPAKYWLSRKMCFQQADLPFLFRLADFTTSFAPSGAGAREVESLLHGRATFRHLLIFGETNSGRTSLAVGIATEHSFAVRTARYLTWAKFIENAQTVSEATRQQGTKIWPWRESDIVLLDDVVEVVDGASRTQPLDVAESLRALPREAIDALAGRHSVWVLGPVSVGMGSTQSWVAQLSQLFNLPAESFSCALLVGGPAGRPKVPVASFSGH